MAPRKNPKSFRNFHSKEAGEFRKITEPMDCGHPSGRINRVRSRNKKLNIPKLVYKFLGNVASLESDNNEERSRGLKHGTVTKKSKKQKAIHVATKSADESMTSVSTVRSVDTNSTICTVPSTPATPKSGIQGTQKFSIQAIKDYIKAGIAEGKRRAKKYMCKALSFGVDTGYLIPTDSDGQVLRVSSALVSFNAQNDGCKSGERGVRQKLRKGGTTCTSEERKRLRRRGPPATQKRPRSPSSVASSTSSAKRGRERPKTKKPKYGKRIKKHKLSPRRAKLKRGPGRPRRSNFAKIKAERSDPTLNPDNEEDGIRVGSKQKYEAKTLTPSGSDEDNAKSIKKENLSASSIENSSTRRGNNKEK